MLREVPTTRDSARLGPSIAGKDVHAPVFAETRLSGALFTTPPLLEPSHQKSRGPNPAEKPRRPLQSSYVPFPPRGWRHRASTSPVSVSRNQDRARRRRQQPIPSL